MRIHHATAAKARKFKITLTVEDNEVVATDSKGARLAAGMQGNKVLEDAITKLTGKPAKGATKKAGVTPEERLAKGLKQIKAAKKARKTRTPSMVDADEAGEEPSDEDLGDIGDVNDDDSDADQGKSVVKAKYKALYKPHKDKCGDSLSFEINQFVTVEDEETGEKKVSKKLLRAFAENNGCWVPAYGSFVSRTGGWNSGMAVMNVGNRLRAKIRQAKKAEQEFKVVWPKV